MVELTARQSAIYRFIRQKTRARGYPPSFREIMDEFGFKSVNAVARHLHALEKKGRIRRLKKKARAIEVVEDTDSLLPESLVERLFDEPGLFALRVCGQKYTDLHIADGDVVIVRPSADARGDLLVVKGASVNEYLLSRREDLTGHSVGVVVGVIRCN